MDLTERRQVAMQPLSPSHTEKAPNCFLITGGTGFLGFHLIPLLLNTGATLRVLSPSPPNEIFKLLYPTVSFIQGSILDRDCILKAAEGVRGIFHLAGLVIHSRQPQFAKQVFEVNIQGTENVVGVAAELGCRVVYASTSGTVGCSLDPSFEATEDCGYCIEVVKKWPYYHSKIIAEQRAKAIAEQENVDLLCLRPSMLLGPWDLRCRSTHTVVSFLKRKIPFVPSGGISYVDVRDAAQAFKTAMLSSSLKGVRTYLLASANCSLQEFFGLLESVSGQPKPRLRLSPFVARLLANVLDKSNRYIRNRYNPGVDPVKAEMASHYWNIDSSAAKKDINFSPRDPRETVMDTIQWIWEAKDAWGPLSMTSARL